MKLPESISFQPDQKSQRAVIFSRPLFTLGSVYNKSANVAEQTTERKKFKLNIIDIAKIPNRPEANQLAITKEYLIIPTPRGQEATNNLKMSK